MLPHDGKRKNRRWYKRMTDSEKLDLIISKLAETDKKLDKLDKLENDVTDIKLTLIGKCRTERL